MSIFSKTLLAFLLILGAGPLWAFDMTREIAELNRDYGRALGYPIVIMDKSEFRKYLVIKNISVQDEEKLTETLMTYFQEKHGVPLELRHAQGLVTYLTAMDKNASAVPFFSQSYPPKMKLCVVMPSHLKGSARQEVEWILGAQGLEHLYSGVDLQRVSESMTVDQLKLFSLYHELSHCLDRKFVPLTHQGEPDAHSVHMAESFAEVNALLLLAQRKNITNMAQGRFVLRSLYSKVLGPYLAQLSGALDSELQGYGGSIYYLARSIKAAEGRLEEATRVLTLEGVLSLSNEITLQSALSNRTFRALHFSFKQGEEKTLAEYHKLATDHPDLFQQAYEELLTVLSALGSLTI